MRAVQGGRLHGLPAVHGLDLQGVEGDRAAVLLDHGDVLQQDGVEAARGVDLIGIDHLSRLDPDLQALSGEGKQQQD